MAGTTVTDLNTAIAAAAGADETLGLSLGVDIVAQLTAAKVKAQEAALIVADVNALTGISGGLTTALATVATDLT